MILRQTIPFAARAFKKDGILPYQNLLFKYITSEGLNSKIVENDINQISREENYDIDEEQLNNLESEPLYENHIPTSFLQKSILSAGAATAALLNPRRHDMVAVLGETTGSRTLGKIYESMLRDTEGQKILTDRPVINSKTVDLDALSKLPSNSLGFMYVKFLNDNNVTPDSRLPVQFIDNKELAYVMQRYREVHDLFHTTLGMPTNMLGEVTVKWIEGIQTGLPMCVGGAIFGPMRLKSKHRKKYMDVYLPWALKVGRNSKSLMNIYFEKRWEQPIEELRAEFNIDPPPDE